jgi:transcriptional regulator with XRE-family HTH domain
VSPKQAKILRKLLGSRGPSEIHRQLDAAGIRLSLPAVSRYLSGDRQADPRFLYGLSQILGVDLADLTEQVLDVAVPVNPTASTSAASASPEAGTARRYLVNLLSRLSDAQVERLITRILDGSLAQWLGPVPETTLAPEAQPRQDER